MELLPTGVQPPPAAAHKVSVSWCRQTTSAPPASHIDHSWGSCKTPVCLSHLPVSVSPLSAGQQHDVKEYSGDF